MTHHPLMPLLAAVSLSLLGAGAAARDGCGATACTPEQLSRCRQANDMALEQARQLPAASKADTERKAALVTQVQTLLANNRRNRVDECSTWSEVGRVASHQ